MFRVCSVCIRDLQRLRSDTEGGYRRLPASNHIKTNCTNRPRCFDQPVVAKRDDEAPIRKDYDDELSK